MLKADNLYFDFFSNDYQKLVITSPISDKNINYLQNSELAGRNYYLTWENDKHYLIINDVLQMGFTNPSFSIC